MRFEKARETLDQFLTLPIQVMVFFAAIILVEAGARIHKVWDRKLDEDLPR